MVAASRESKRYEVNKFIKEIRRIKKKMRGTINVSVKKQSYSVAEDGKKEHQEVGRLRNEDSC